MVPDHAHQARGLIVTAVAVRDFRSYGSAEVELPPGLTAIVGANGAGKTNLLEAIHYGTQGFSPRTRRDARAIRFGTDAARVALQGTRSTGVAFVTEVTIATGGTKRLVLDGAPVASSDELRRHFPVLAFTPDRLAVVKGGPVVRRTYLDRMLGRLTPARAQLPGEYGRALAQRNAALRRTREGLSSRDAIEPWSESLARLGTALDASRAAAIALLAPEFAAVTGALGLDDGILEYDASGLTTAELSARLDRDLERGTTGAGPHLRDLRIAAGERDLRSFGSQGEQRVAVLGLLLAEARVLLEQADDPPLLLLDDVMSELDENRRQALVDEVPGGCQTIVTATSDRSLPAAAVLAAVVEVSPGSAVRR